MGRWDSQARHQAGMWSATASSHGSSVKHDEHIETSPLLVLHGQTRTILSVPELFSRSLSEQLMSELKLSHRIDAGPCNEAASRSPPTRTERVSVSEEGLEDSGLRKEGRVERQIYGNLA